MSLAVIDQALRAVPYVQTLGVRVEEARPGHVVLRIPYGKAVTSHGGAIATGAIFSVGEMAAAVVLATHPTLGRLVNLQKSSRIKYFASATKDVTAHATLTPEAVRAVEDALTAGTPASLDVSVKVLDGHGADVAELLCHFAFRKA